jgi:quinol monooxygenase YgiN
VIALITRVSILPNKMDQALRIAKTSVKPTEQKEGCLGLFIMANRESRELVSLSLWESERALKAIEDDGFADQHASRLSTVIADHVSGIPYEVAEASQIKTWT